MTVSNGNGQQLYKRYVAYNQLHKPIIIYAEGQDSHMFKEQGLYYNTQGKLSKQIDYIYDQDDTEHLLTTTYQYDRYGKKAAIEHSDGSTDVIVNEPYYHRTMTYKLIPTTTVIEGDGDSLCHTTIDGERQAVQCDVRQVQVQHQIFNKDENLQWRRDRRKGVY
mgnify:CR=1 FL=1